MQVDVTTTTSPHHTVRPAAISDEELMRRIQRDDRLAFEVLYDRYSPSAFGLARVICRDTHRAEDAAQDGFLAAWRSRNSYDPARGSARAWLLMVVRNRSIDLIRSTRRDAGCSESADELDYLPAPDSVAEDVEQHDEAQRIRSSLLALPALQREVIALAYFGGLTHTEIAARLQLPAGTVKGRMRLGLDKMRADVDASCPDIDASCPARSALSPMAQATLRPHDGHSQPNDSDQRVLIC